MHEHLPVGTIIAGTTEQLGLRGAEHHELFRDYETRSRLKLKSVGTYRYAAAPDTEVICCAYVVDDEPVKLWQPGDAVPAEFIEAANNPNWTVVAHGDHFESAIEHYIMAPVLVFPSSQLNVMRARWQWLWRPGYRRGCRPRLMHLSWPIVRTSPVTA
jgi:hypothetical protein